MQAFVDESERGSRSFIVAAVVSTADVARVRAEMRGLLAAGQRRLHFNSESNHRRADLLARMLTLDTRAWVYETGTRSATARHDALGCLVDDLCRVDARRLVLESREGRDHLDRQSIYLALRANGHDPDRLVYDHLRPHEEPMLWIADAVAWAVGAGRRWQQRVSGMIDRHIRIGS